MAAQELDKPGAKVRALLTEGIDERGAGILKRYGLNIPSAFFQIHLKDTISNIDAGIQDDRVIFAKWSRPVSQTMA